MSNLRKIRTTMEPDREYEVTEQEFTDLQRQGLLLDEPEAKPARKIGSREAISDTDKADREAINTKETDR